MVSDINDLTAEFFILLPFRQGNRFVIEEPDEDERNDTDEPFEVDDMREKMDCWYELP